MMRSGQQDGRRDAVLVGLVGQGITLSRTPTMHETEAAHQGLPLVYRRLDTDAMARAASVGEVVEAAELLGFAGLNVTHPYKMDVIRSLDSLSEAARAIGAVNTVVFKDGARAGHNTDLWGFRESLRRAIPEADLRRVLLIGAGGAGSAVAHALADVGVETLLVADTDTVRAETLTERLAQTRPTLAVERVPTVEAAEEADGVVNATPMGMASHPGTPYPPERLRPGLWVADIVYFPLETELLRTARAAGCQVLSGAGMAVFQAARAFELFTGIRPDATRMQATFDSLGRG